MERRWFLRRVAATAAGGIAAAVGMKPHEAEAQAAVFSQFAAQMFRQFLASLAAKAAWYYVQSQFIDDRSKTAVMTAVCYEKVNGGYRCRVCRCTISGNRVTCN